MVEYLTLTQVAEALQVSRSAIRGYVARGVLPVRRIRSSRLLRVARSDVEALLEPRAERSNKTG